MNINDLEQKLIEQRKVWVKVNDLEFQLMRPSELDIFYFQQEEDKTKASLNLLEKSVVDWKLKESDLMPGRGGVGLVPFSPALFQIFISDNLEIVALLFDELLNVYTNYIEKISQSKKK